MSTKRKKSSLTKEQKKAILDRLPTKRMTKEEWFAALEHTEPAGRMDLFHLKRRLPGETWPWHDEDGSQTGTS